LRTCAIVPVCAATGANVRVRADAAWWTGPTLVEALDALPATPPRVGGPLRLPVDDVLAGGESRIAVGRVASGTVAAGHDVLILPGNRTAKVEGLAGREGAHASATIGERASVALAPDAVVERGDLLCSPDAPPKLTAVFDADLRWLGPGGLATGGALSLLVGTREVRARVASIHHVADASGAHRPATSLREGDIARITIRCEAAIAVDDAKTLPATGRFLLAGDDGIAGAGAIDASGYPDQRRTRPASARSCRCATRSRRASAARGSVTRARSSGSPACRAPANRRSRSRWSAGCSTWAGTSTRSTATTCAPASTRTWASSPRTGRRICAASARSPRCSRTRDSSA